MQNRSQRTKPEFYHRRPDDLPQACTPHSNRICLWSLHRSCRWAVNNKSDCSWMLQVPAQFNSLTLLCFAAKEGMLYRSYPSLITHVLQYPKKTVFDVVCKADRVEGLFRNLPPLMRWMTFKWKSRNALKLPWVWNGSPSWVGLVS